MDSENATQAALLRPIIGIENRTPREVFDIMCDRFRHASAQPAPEPEYEGNAFIGWYPKHSPLPAPPSTVPISREGEEHLCVDCVGVLDDDGYCQACEGARDSLTVFQAYERGKRDGAR